MESILSPAALLRTLLGDTNPESAPAAVARYLVGTGPATGAEIADATALSRASVSQVLTEFRKRGLVVESNADATTAKRRGRGRPQMLQSIAPRMGHAVGVLLGLHELRVLLADTAHTKIADVSIPIEVDYHPEQAVDVLKVGLGTILGSHGTSVHDLLGIGLAVAAPISPDGHIGLGSIIPSWNGIDLAAVISEAFPCPVYADNESNCAAQSKMLWGEARGLKDFVYVTFDYGIGGAIVFDQLVRRGANGTAAEFGHMRIEDPGRPCRCGRNGCLETLAAVDVVLSQATAAKGKPVDLPELRRLLSAGDSVAANIVGAAGTHCGTALATVSSVLSPGCYVLDGIMTGLGSSFLDPLQAAFHGANRGSSPQFVFAAASLDDKMLGAIGLVLRQQGLLSCVSARM